jgi:restriction system protein
LKIRMAENSLFAVLLRSPWWISVLIGSVLSVLALALLPVAYRVVGAVGTLPFFVIAALAARRQWKLPSAAQVTQTTEAVSVMGWPAFAQQLEEAFQRNGWTVTRSTTEPVDFALERQGRRLLVHARRWKSARLGLEVLRSLQARREADGAQDALCICLGDLSDTARPFATRNHIAVWRAGELAQALRGAMPSVTPKRR